MSSSFLSRAFGTATTLTGPAKNKKKGLERYSDSTVPTTFQSGSSHLLLLRWSRDPKNMDPTNPPTTPLLHLWHPPDPTSTLLPLTPLSYSNPPNPKINVWLDPTGSHCLATSDAGTSCYISTRTRAIKVLKKYMSLKITSVGEKKAPLRESSLPAPARPTRNRF